MAAYRITITDGEAGANGNVILSVTMQKETSPNVWEDVRDTTVNMDGAAMSTILEDSNMTSAQKATAIAAFFKAEVNSQGVIRADEAYDGLMELVPGGWPVTLDL